MVKKPENGPANGDCKQWRDQDWIAHCGMWWSLEAWVAIDPLHRPAPGRKCLECGDLLVDKVSRDRTIADEKAGKFKHKLRDGDHGEYVPFLPEGGGDDYETVRVGRTVVLHASPFEPLLATHLAFAADCLGCFSIVALRTGRNILIAGPLSADYFAVRVSVDTALPIDRGGSLPEQDEDFSRTIIPGIPAVLQLRNIGKEAMVARCAVLGLPFPKARV